MLGIVRWRRTAGAVDLDMRDRWAVRAARASAAAGLWDEPLADVGAVNHAGVCFGGGTIEARMRGAVTGREHTGPLWHQAAGRAGSATPQRRGRRRRGGAQAARHAYGFVDIAALGLADVGVRQRWLERVVDASTRWSAPNLST